MLGNSLSTPKTERAPELAAAAWEIEKNVTGVQGNVSNLGDLNRFFAQIKREKGKLDIVFANAGVATYAPFGNCLWTAGSRRCKTPGMQRAYLVLGARAPG
jgi:NAD(P)-dependent dehydrogenase (short-subunit alcohol dehydrogenase family)